ncbi:putative conserved membrane protein [Synechococcus sp. PROS-U-1]|nr:hypothetical protein [Synechococcus sp. PROS-U-1]QNJ02846.1 putative conserved membrane protein [Synechococcus sp. PROS-U-1]
MEWNDAESPLLIISSLFIGLQICWIGAMLRRNQRRRLGEPLSSTAFQRELERIFSRADGVS